MFSCLLGEPEKKKEDGLAAQLGAGAEEKEAAIAVEEPVTSSAVEGVPLVDASDKQRECKKIATPQGVHVDTDATPSQRPAVRQTPEQRLPALRASSPQPERVTSLLVSVPLTMVKLRFAKATDVGRRLTRSSRSRTPGWSSRVSALKR